jgi:hypothetical protein
MSAGGCSVAHRWSAWRPLASGLLERRCACGSVERGSYDAVNAAELEKLAAVLAAWRRTFGDEPPRHE